MKETKKNNSLTHILARSSPNWLLLAIMSGMFSGICYSAVIPFVLYSLRPQAVENLSLDAQSFTYFDSPMSSLAGLFLINCLLILITKSLSLILVDYLARGAAVNLKVEIYKKVQKLPIRRLEVIGPSKIINVLTKDIPVVSQSISALPHIWVNSVTVVGLLGYLVYLNVQVFVFVLACIILGAVTYQIPLLFGSRYIRRARERHTKIQDGIHGLLSGAKELKLNDTKSSEYLQHALITSEKKALREDRIGMGINLAAITYGDLISFFVVGVTAYHLPYVFNLAVEDLFGIIMVLLYIIGPMGVILNLLPTLKRGKVALGQISVLENEVLETTSKPVVFADWQSLRLHDVAYQYQDEQSAVSYCLEPVSAEFCKGQISFIVGGNGSGKSTLGKIISHHYCPDSGEIFLGETKINADNRQSIRELTSSIYSDFFVFEKLYGLERLPAEKIAEYLDYLQLTEKVSISDGVINNVNLSAGQKRRLALLVALLEDRDIYLFDEWAADQDPEFKQVFYQQVLQDLKARGKLVIAITHDDRYFSCADQLIYMERGKVAAIEARKN